MLSLNHIVLRLEEFSLHDITFDVDQGDYCMLLGESGAGKSLILEMIAGLVTPSSGVISLRGEEITHKRIQDRNIGLVFQDYAVFPHLSVRANIAYPLKGRFNTDEKQQRIQRIAEKLGILHVLHRSPVTLSGGELQRVALARTLVLEPSVLLLDEPLSSLDPKLKASLRTLLKHLHQEGQTILHVTHDLQEALFLADKVVVIEQGTISRSGPPEEIFRHTGSEFLDHFTNNLNPPYQI
ncbi:MAG: ATP-binding cassette domain-containing protein [Bacteroidales bacterium]|nr:ATP-binding cassette domain-containing protein [Bacteroidales bacterium]